MKTFPSLLLIMLMVFCAQSPSFKNTNSVISVEEIPPISNQTAENNLLLLATPDKIVATVPVKVPAFSTQESIEDLSKTEKLNRLKEFGLYDLEKRPIAKGDLEIRIWQINGLYMRAYKDLAVKESVFIFKRTDGDWSAKVFRNVLKGNSRGEKQIETKLDVPKSGWENVWQNLVDNELLTFPDLISGKVEYANDASIFISESKVDGDYKTYVNAGSQETKEIRHIAKILNIIADEFNLEDFGVTKKYE